MMRVGLYAVKAADEMSLERLGSYFSFGEAVAAVARAAVPRRAERERGRGPIGSLLGGHSYTTSAGNGYGF